MLPLLETLMLLESNPALDANSLRNISVHMVLNEYFIHENNSFYTTQKVFDTCFETPKLNIIRESLAPNLLQVNGSGCRPKARIEQSYVRLRTGRISLSTVFFRLKIIGEYRGEGSTGCDDSFSSIRLKRPSILSS